jgi:hypothetical protein
MKQFAFALVALPLTFWGASAQGVYIGPGGVGVDTGMHGRDSVVREYQDDDGCRVRVIQHYQPDGDVETRKIRRCD